MAFVNFLRSTPGQVCGVLVGFALIAVGAMQISLAGLILMMVGMVPAVMGVAGMCLPEEIAGTRHATEALRRRTGEGRA